MVQQINKDKRSITLDKDVADYIERIAEKEDRSFSQQINKVLKDYIKSQEEGKE